MLCRVPIRPTPKRNQSTRRNVSLDTPFGNRRLNLVIPVAQDEAPSGMMARGHYEAVSKFVDDDDVTHLKFEWSFDIAKDWK